MKIDILYKDYSLIDNEEHLIQEEFECWHQEGNYTSFYKNYDSKCPVPKLIVPTNSVCWIKPKE